MTPQEWIDALGLGIGILGALGALANYWYTNRRFKTAHYPVVRASLKTVYQTGVDGYYNQLIMTVSNLSGSVAVDRFRITLRFRRLAKWWQFWQASRWVLYTEEDAVWLGTGPDAGIRVFYCPEGLEDFLREHFAAVSEEPQAARLGYRVLDKGPFQVTVDVAYKPALYAAREVRVKEQYVLTASRDWYLAQRIADDVETLPSTVTARENWPWELTEKRRRGLLRRKL